MGGVLVFCTSYATDLAEWRLRYRRWVERIRSSGLRYKKIALIDDGSPLLPPWARTVEVGRRAPVFGGGGTIADVELHHFPDNLGRRTILDFPGWYRSFAYSAEIARRMDASKIIHIESDAALLSHEAVAWANTFHDGWAAPWSAMYGFPEMAIQVIAGSSLPAYYDLLSKPYDWLRDRIHETALPYTHVIRPFVGDRYTGETGVVRDADFLTQIPSAREDGFAWWEQGLGTSTPACEPEVGPDTVFRMEFSAGTRTAERCGFGWGAPEGAFRWTVGLDSRVDLPPDTPASTLLLDLGPCMEPQRHPFQKLQVHLDGRELGRFKLPERLRLRVPLPEGGTGRGRLRLHHPDAVRAKSLDPSLDDERELGFYVHTIAGLAD